MAHQYPNTPGYNAAYPPNPFYPLYNTTPSQQGSNNAASYPQTSQARPPMHTSGATPNSMRFEANAQIPHPSGHLPFPPPFNPEMFKHFPPPANFPPAPGTPTGYTQPSPNQTLQLQQSQTSHSPHNFNPFSNITPYQHNFPKYASSTHYSDFAGQIAGQAPGANEDHNTHNDNGYGVHSNYVSHQVVGTDGPSSLQNSIRSNGEAFSLDQTPAAARVSEPKVSSQAGLDATSTTSASALDTSNKFVAQEVIQAITPTDVSNTSAGINSVSHSNDSSSHAALRESAKMAVRSLASFDITFGDFVTEGIDSETLKQLYAELGLQSHHDNTTEVSVAPGKENVPPSLTVTTQSTNSAKQVAPESRPSPAPTPGMERKDRIAQLLAAKAGKTIPSIGSQSASPQPSAMPNPARSSTAEKISAAFAKTESTSLPSLDSRQAAHSNAEQQRSVKLKNGTVTKPQIVKAQSNLNTTTDPDTATPGSLSTPVKQQLTQSRISSGIPGLFMTAADFANERTQPSNTHQSETAEDSNTSVHQMSTLTNSSPRSSQKRPADSQPLIEHVRDSKRQELEPATNHDTEMELDRVDTKDVEDASEGEIIEDDDRVMRDTDSSALPAIIAHVKTTSHTERQGAIRDNHVDSQQSVSGTSTPLTSQIAQKTTDSPASRLGENLQERGIPSPRPIVKLTPAQIVERAAQLKADFLRQRALRQKQSQEVGPTRPDEMSKMQDQIKQLKVKLAESQLELRRHEENVARAREEEQNVSKEIERLEKQLQDSAITQQQSAIESERVKQQTDSKQTMSESKEQPSTLVSETTIALPAKPLNSSAFSAHSSTLPEHLPSTQTFPSAESGPASPDLALAAAQPEEEGTTMDPHMSLNSSIKSPHTADASDIEHEDAMATTDVDKSFNDLTSDQVDDQSDDQSMDQSDSASNDSRMSIDDLSEDSVSMSDSGSEDYEPAEPGHTQDPEGFEEESEDYEPDDNDGEHAVSNIAGDADHYDPSKNTTGDVDAYEPTEDIKVLDAHALQLTPHDTTSPLTSIAGSVDQVGESPEYVSMQDLPTENKSATVLQTDDQENGLQLSEADTLTKSQNTFEIVDVDDYVLSGTDAQPSERFIPYQSPLTSFKSYRFHPSFNDNVKTGYRSLTYSNKIDPKLPLCPTELSGQDCTDPTCEEQHFRSMGLTDDKILVQMSSANDIKDKTLRDQYLLGLKQVIASLRLNGVKEFSLVADALSKYRREWSAAQMSM